jgi:hypothetical protein
VNILLANKMSRIAYLRLGTYAILLVCFFFPNRHRVIPLRLPATGVDAEWWDWPEPYFNGGSSPASLPGFADTRLSGKEIARSALECVRRENIDPAQLSWLRIKLAMRGEKLVWIVTWDIVSDPSPRPTGFQVIIDDASGHAAFEERRR